MAPLTVETGPKKKKGPPRQGLVPHVSFQLYRPPVLREWRAKKKAFGGTNDIQGIGRPHVDMIGLCYERQVFSSERKERVCIPLD